LELRKHRLNKGLDPNLFYYRDAQKNEVDVIYKCGHQLIPIEIKSSMTYHNDFLKGLQDFHALVKERAPHSFLIYAGNLEQKMHETQILNFHHSHLALNP